MRVAMLTPLPPNRTGVAHYASMILPALQKQLDVTAFASLDDYRRVDFDLTIYQLGNNPHHEFVYREAMEHPGVIVLHDVVLHHLIVEMTLARGDAPGYIEALQQNHGQAGAAWARGRAAGLHSEMGNFLFPASVEVARRSRAVVVHNHYAADQLRSFGVETPIHVVGHPYVAESATFNRDLLRLRLGFTSEDRVIGLFGFLTSAKRGEVVAQAFRRARRLDPELRLLIVGEPAPNIDIASLGGEGIIVTGYVSDDDFGAYYRAADRLVNLRYPSAGETSGTLIRAFDAGRPVAVSDYAQFAEFPNTSVTKIPLGEGEIEALEKFFLGDFDINAIAIAQRKWLEENASLDKTVAGYVSALSSVAPGPSTEQGSTRAAEGPSTPLGAGSGPTVSLFPSLELVSASRTETHVSLRLRNTGAHALRAREYGAPGYRLIARLFAGQYHVGDRWLALPHDVRVNDEVTVHFDTTNRGAMTLRLFHALESIPHLEGEPWASVELASV